MPDTISFARGAPSADILPHEQVRDAAQRALTDDWETALSYGVGIGHPGLCKWVAERHGGVDPRQVMTTNGALEAGAMLFAHLVKPGTRVAVEQPTYDRTLLLLQQLGAELVPIPLEADGLDVGALETALAEGPIEFVHVIPNAHNPAGGTVFHASSFSKTVSPGIRVGYLIGPPEEVAKLAKKANEMYISPNMVAGSIVLQLCTSGVLDENIDFVKGELKARCEALVEALREKIPEAVFVVPQGGYFLWLDLAEGTDAKALLAESKGEGVSFVAGPDFMIAGGENSLRLSFAPV